MEFDWKPQFENYTKASKDDLKFIFDQAEKQLKDVTETNALIVSRTTTLITITVGAMFALIGYSFSRWDKLNQLDSYIATAIIGIIYLLNISRLLIKNIMAQEYWVIGTEPKSLYVENHFKDNESLQRMYYSEIVNYQYRIEKNKDVNEKRWDLYHRSLKSIVFIPLFLTIVFCIIKALAFALEVLSA